MRIFCGLDPQRAVSKKSSAFDLYIYSRASGRWIKYFGDARVYLGLGAGSTNMGPGLTILLDDYEGSLETNTTKQDIAFPADTQGQAK